ncbi:hypothetical protein [Persicirhabdus sediminis]|uniref:Uncharacterized protein n=1 Tax=Persicirhabdus sediminis TaxID=454144 RepID=A0A8J7MH63_9BACT|nr:hypothetical protein [Persicirhabdus sediminis]MBK1792796.1 hypothetical protein [Persicirhabdus sediminis]
MTSFSLAYQAGMDTTEVSSFYVGCSVGAAQMNYSASASSYGYYFKGDGESTAFYFDIVAGMEQRFTEHCSGNFGLRLIHYGDFDVFGETLSSNFLQAALEVGITFQF